MSIKVTFHGACGIVTGSCFEISTARTAILIDCGMFQGTKSIKQLNYDPFPFAPQDIKAVVLTHAHIDHCGLAPKLMRAGYKGPIVATPATADLLAYVLPDSGYVQEMEVEHLNRRNHHRGRPAVDPIYTRADGEACAQHVTGRPLDTWIDIAPGIRIRFWDAGHILGSASVEMLVSDRGDAAGPDALRLLFSGDIGPGEKAFQQPPKAPAGADYLFVESTYGDRLRPKRSQAQRRTALRNEIKAGLKAGGMILIPAFAVERTQELLVDLDALFDGGDLPALPVFIDSPLATNATRVFAKYIDTVAAPASPFNRPNLHYVEDAQDSRKLSRLRSGGIIIAGSGMCDAGRIRHHLKNNLGDGAATVLLVGYQAPGTLGRLLSQGVSMVRIEGEEIAVKARVRGLEDYSGHADQAGLVAWIKARMPIAHNIFLVHGEENARTGLAACLAEAGIDARCYLTPQMGETVRLTAAGAKTERIRSSVDIAAVAMADWHNAYARTVLDLRKRLDSLPNDAARQKLLDRLATTLDKVS